MISSNEPRPTTKPWKTVVSGPLVTKPKDPGPSTFPLTFEFSSREARDAFLSQFCDGGGDDAMYEGMEAEGFSPRFNYSKAFKAWGATAEQVRCPTVIVETGE